MIDGARSARSLAAGASLGKTAHAPLTRLEFAWYLVASYDRNPIHVDEPFARAAGFPAVIGQGMIPLGFIASRLVGEVGHVRLRGLSGDFVGSLFPGEELVTDIVLDRAEEKSGGVELHWRISAENKAGESKLRGRARTFHEEDDASRR